MTLHQDCLRVLLAHALIHTHVLTRRDFPRKVFAHAVLHKPLPRSLIAVHLQRLMYRAQQRISGLLLKLESRALFRPGVPGVHCIVESSG